MVTALVDSSIIIDNLRNHLPAINWFANANMQLGITRIVRLEIIEGALNKSGLIHALTLLNDFDHIETIEADFIWASAQLIKFRLSHNVGGVDCLIAAASYRLQIPLYTMNLKHFSPLLGSLAQKPY